MSTSPIPPTTTPSTFNSSTLDPSQTSPSSSSPTQTDPKWNSPGNHYSPNPTTTPPMKLPNLSFLYRLEYNIAREEIDVGAPHSAGIIRSIANIVDGEVNGPRIKGTVLPLGGADWATVVEGTHSMTLDARYTVRTHDKPPPPSHIFIRAHGLYRPGPDTAYSHSVAANPTLPAPETATQDDVEFFSHLRLEAGPGKYNWMNGVVCLGVMCCVGTRIVIDVYYLTNFLGREPEDVVAVRSGGGEGKRETERECEKVNGQ